jgi:hypothetical protein
MAKKAAKTGAAKGAAPIVEDTDEASDLEKQVEKDTTAPADVLAIDRPAPTPVSSKEILKNKETGVLTIRPTGRFEAIGSLIFNREGVHVGSEANDNDAARRADRFNSLTQKR